jgi:hypothetical protein
MRKMRYLSPNEKWYYFADFFTPTNISVFMIWNECFTREVVERALRDAQIKIEIFNCLIDDSIPQKPQWVRPEEDLAIELKWGNVSNNGPVTPQLLHSLSEEEQLERMDYHTGLLKCRVVQSVASTGVILTTPHYVADGTSLFILANEFNLSLKSEFCGKLKFPLTDPLETLFPPETLGVKGLWRWVVLQLQNLYMEIRLTPFRIGQKVDLKNRITKFQHFEATPELSQKILLTRKGITVNDLMTLAFAKSIRTVLCPDAKSVAVGCPINLRQFIDKQEIFGPYVSALISYPSVMNQSSSETLRLIRKRFKKGINKLHIFLALKPLVFVTRGTPEGSEGLFQKITQLGPGNITLSNMGKLNLPQDMQYISFSGSLNISGFLMLGSCSYQDGQVRFLLSWVDGVLAREQISSIQIEFLKELDTLTLG